ncbi:MAG TPA: AsmA family protein, partial [Acidobacteriota bacterium]
MKRVLHFSARALRAIILTVVLLLVAGAIFLNSNYFDSIIKDLIETKGGPAIRRDINVGTVAFNPFKLDVLLKDFTIGNDPRSPESPFFTSEEIYARVSWRHLMRGKLRIREVRLKKPVLNLIFYEKSRGAGNNFPTRAKKEVQEKKRELDIIVSQADVQNMTIVMDQRRFPLSFSVKDLQARVNYDFIQNNYAATTSFKSGFLKIQHYEFWKFDMKAEYRIVGNHLSFDKLNFVSAGSKFYLTGDMYASNKPFFDMIIRPSNIDLSQAKYMFHLGPEMDGKGIFRGQYRGTFEKFVLKGACNFQNFIFYKLPIDQAIFNIDLTENRLDVSNIKASMFEGAYNGTFAIAPLKGKSVFTADAKWKNWDGRRLGRFIRMADMILPVKASGSANLRWEEGRSKDMTGDVRFKLEPHEALTADLAIEAERSRFNNALFQKAYVLPAYNETEFRLEGRQMRDLKSHLQTPYTTMDVSGTIDFSGEANLDVVSHTTKIAEIDLLFHHLQAYFSGRPARTQEFWAVRGAADFTGKLDATVWNPFRPRLTGEVIAGDVVYH